LTQRDLKLCKHSIHNYLGRKGKRLEGEDEKSWC
jgi:hypothetical protein